MAEMNNLTALIIGLMVIGIVLGIGFLVLEEFEGTIGTDTASVDSEVVGAVVNNTCSYVARNHTTADLFCYNSFAVSQVKNATSGEVIDSANYSVQALTGCIYPVPGASVEYVNSSSWNVSYSYQYGNNSACDGLNETIEATKQIPVWLGIIVIIFIVGILLAIVFKVLPTGGSEGAIAQV